MLKKLTWFWAEDMNLRRCLHGTGKSLIDENYLLNYLLKPDTGNKEEINEQDLLNPAPVLLLSVVFKFTWLSWCCLGNEKAELGMKWLKPTRAKRNILTMLSSNLHTSTLVELTLPSMPRSSIYAPTLV